MGLNLTEFAVESMVREISPVQSGDLVYVSAFCAIREVLHDASRSGLHRIRLAKEVDANAMLMSTTQCHYHFHHDSPIAEVASGDVLWPTDLTFLAHVGAFCQQNSSQMIGV